MPYVAANKSLIFQGCNILLLGRVPFGMPVPAIYSVFFTFISSLTFLCVSDILLNCSVIPKYFVLTSMFIYSPASMNDRPSRWAGACSTVHLALLQVISSIVAQLAIAPSSFCRWSFNLVCIFTAFAKSTLSHPFSCHCTSCCCEFSS